MCVLPVDRNAISLLISWEVLFVAQVGAANFFGCPYEMSRTRSLFILG
jgi:hypothetical protein